MGTLIDDKTEKLLLTEKQKWRHILKVILDAILHCIKNNDALRGSLEIIGHPNCGKFLNTIEVISHYDPTIASHIKSHNKNQISYFSPTVQNELIHLIGNKVRNTIISNIVESKYYCLMLDCTHQTHPTRSNCRTLLDMSDAAKPNVP